MYRYRRRRKLQRRRRTAVVSVFSAVLAMVVGIPTLAAADPVNDALNGLGLGSGSGDTGGGGTVTPQQSQPGEQVPYTPPLHGTNPHGQGTNAVIDIGPNSNLPYSSNPQSSGEEVVVGSSRGEQDAATGTYRGSVTLAFLFGQPIVQVQTDPNNPQASGPTQQLNDGLANICTQSGGQLCLTVLDMQSSSSSSGSSNSFTGASVGLGGPEGLGVNALSSQGNISESGGCQTANGSSEVAGASAGGDPLAGVFRSSSQSTAGSCGSSVTQSSQAIVLGPEEQEVLPGCADGTPNTVIPLAPLLAVICNANDQNGSQTSAPYGVREALTTLALLIDLEQPGIGVVKATTAAAESHTVAPAQAVTSTGPTASTAPPAAGVGPGAGGKKGADDKAAGPGAGEGAGAGAGAAAAAAGPGAGELAFTGADLLALGMVGGALILGGLALTKTAVRRHRQTV
jgi:hypothetical protein